MNSPKLSSESVEIPHPIPLFLRSSQYASNISLSPVKNREKVSMMTEHEFPQKMDSFSLRPFDMEEENRSRGYSFKKSQTRFTRNSILMINKRTSSISISPRKPSFLSDIDESRNKKKILNVLDVYTEEQLITLAIKILQKPKNYRSGTDVKMLMKCTEKVSFFAEMITNQESEKHEECCKAMGYKLASHGETIVKEGTIGQTFYIILKGMVGIYKGESVELSGSNTSIKDVDTNAKSMTKKTSLLLKPVSQAQNLRRYSTKALETQYNPDNLNKIKVLKAGEAFGELSLMENKPRAATVICEQECHLAILEKQYFDKILKEFEKKKLFKQIDFFSSLKLFSSWSYNAVKNLYYLSSQQEFKKFMIVYKENDPAEDVFIIKSGEFKVVKTFERDTQNSPTKMFLMKRGSKIKSQKIDICLLGPGEAFGEEEVIEKLPRQHTVICNSIIGVVYVIERKEFLKRVLLSQTAKKQLEVQITSKSEWREKRIDDKEIMNEKMFLKKGGLFSEGNIDPEEFAMIKGQSAREKNVITNIRDVYFNPFMVLQIKISKEKVKMIPVMENIVDPVNLVNSLKNKGFLQQMTANTPKRNFFILNNLILQDKRKEEHTNTTKKNQIKSKNFAHQLQEIPIKSFEEKSPIVKNTDETSNKYQNQIILPMSNNSINNYLRLRTSSDNEYQLTGGSQTQKKKHSKKKSTFLKESPRESANCESLVVEGKGSFDSQRKLSLNRKKLSTDFTNDLKSFLPLKYSSENIKRTAHTATLSVSTIKTSRNENIFEDAFLTSRHY